MKYLLEFHPIQLWSFFFGLILASAIYILKGLDKWSLPNIISLLAGVGIAAFICVASPAQTPDALWFIFLSGAIAICAMILPGISGSFILLLLGKYAFVMTAVTELNIPVLAVFAVGCAVGIVSFSHFLSWLLKKFYMLTIALLSGFMLGSLLKVWPWKVPGASEGFDYPALPAQFEQVTGLDAQLGTSIAFAVLGLAIVLVIEFVAAKGEKK
jgi:putative membrane protein